jgi:hypothetical protein
MDRHGSVRLPTPEDVFTDFRARRDGILKALTTGISPSSPLLFRRRFVVSLWISLWDS